MSFNHFDEYGRAIMVDVSGKKQTLRTAVVRAIVKMKPETLVAILDNTMSKGDVLGVARLAGISAAKKTPDLIPLSHPLALHAVTVDYVSDPESGTITVDCMVRAFERTGVEMEAMVGASIASLTIYDMCKGVDKAIVVSDIMLMYKEGGKSGVFRRENIL